MTTHICLLSPTYFSEKITNYKLSQRAHEIPNKNLVRFKTVHCSKLSTTTKKREIECTSHSKNINWLFNWPNLNFNKYHHRNKFRQYNNIKTFLEIIELYRSLFRLLIENYNYSFFMNQKHEISIFHMDCNGFLIIWARYHIFSVLT